MKSKKVKKILLIALTCVAISASVSAEAAMKSQITIESKNKYEQLKISERRVYGEYPTGDYKKIMLLPSVSKVAATCPTICAMPTSLMVCQRLLQTLF